MMSTDEVGISSDRVLEPNKIDLINVQCSICHEILWKPVACQTCETPFCCRCITPWIDRNPGKCPVRCGKYVQRLCPRFILENLSRLQIHCIYQPNGCTEVVAYEALDKHETQCDYRIQKCSGCQQELLKKDFEKHAIDCPSIDLTCEKCQLVYKRIDVGIVHTELHCLRTQLQRAEEKIAKLNEQLENQSQEHLREIHRIRQECEEHIQQVTGKRTRWPRLIPNIPLNARWIQNGLTVAGANGQGDSLNQLSRPFEAYIDDDQTLYITDWGNHRIIAWKVGATSGQVVAGGNGQGNRTDQLNNPTGVIMDKDLDSLIICDMGNRRIVRWSHRTCTYQETILDNIDCTQISMDDQRFLYVSDVENYQVKRYRLGDTDGTIVAGGHDEGFELNQLSYPTYLFIDRDESVFVSDTFSHRVMKWPKGATEGIVVAGGRGGGDDWVQLDCPNGVVVDQLGAIYVADLRNHRIVRWHNGINLIVGGNGKGLQANQLNSPSGLAFDRLGNLYVVDHYNHRVQRFDIQINS